MEMEAEKISEINRGRTAHVTLNWMNPIFDDQRKKLVSDLKNLYRSGDFSESKMVAVAAGLCTLDDIVSRLEQVIRTAEHAAKEINGTESNPDNY